MAFTTADSRLEPAAVTGQRILRRQLQRHGLPDQRRVGVLGVLGERWNATRRHLDVAEGEPMAAGQSRQGDALLAGEDELVAAAVERQAGRDDDRSLIERHLQSVDDAPSVHEAIV